jgi:hypothetical protein
LEVALILNHTGVAKLMVLSGGIYPKLDALRRALRAARRERAAGQAIDRITGQELRRGGHGGQC